MAQMTTLAIPQFPWQWNTLWEWLWCYSRAHKKYSVASYFDFPLELHSHGKLLSKCISNYTHFLQVYFVDSNHFYHHCAHEAKGSSSSPRLSSHIWFACSICTKVFFYLNSCLFTHSAANEFHHQTTCFLFPYLVEKLWKCNPDGYQF